MPVINLIQEQRQALHTMEQRARIAFLTLVGTGIAGAFGYGILLLQGEALKTEKGRLENDLARTRPVLAEIDDNEKLQAQLTPELSTLQDAQKQSDRWAHILRHLSTQTPPNTWLTALQASSLQGDKPTSLVIQGTARSQQPIGEFILRFENEPDLTNVALHFTQEKRSSKNRAVDFEIGADIAGSEEEKPVVKETKS
jgi:Tfp pilus assembly protein PilN